MQRIQSCLRIIAIPSVPIRILRPHGACKRTSRRQRLSPGVVGVLHDDIAVRIIQSNDVPLAVVQVVVLRAIQVHGQQRAVGVVAVVDGIRAVRLVRDPAVDVGVRRGHAVYSFRGAIAVGVVGEGQRAARLAHAHELAALCPGIRPLAVREQVADLIVLEAAAVVAGQQVAPAAAVRIAIGYRIQRRAETARCIGIFALAEYVSCRVIRPRPGLSGGLVVFAGQLAKIVIDIGRRTAVCRDRRDIPTVIICVRRCLVKLRSPIPHRGQQRRRVRAVRVEVPVGGRHARGAAHRMRALRLAAKRVKRIGKRIVSIGSLSEDVVRVVGKVDFPVRAVQCFGNRRYIVTLIIRPLVGMIQRIAAHALFLDAAQPIGEVIQLLGLYLRDVVLAQRGAAHIVIQVFHTGVRLPVVAHRKDAVQIIVFIGHAVAVAVAQLCEQETLPRYIICITDKCMLSGLNALFHANVLHLHIICLSDHIHLI